MAVKRICLIVVALMCLSWSLSTYALTNEEKLELLEEKYLKGEIPTNLYLELREKYKGKSKETPSEEKSLPEESGQIKNGDFEGPLAGGVPQHWQKYRQVTVSLDKQVKYSGSQAVKLVSTINNRTVGIKQTVSVRGGDRYEFSVWAKGENLSRNAGDVIFASIEIPGQKKLNIDMGTKTKERILRKKFEVPAGVNQVTIGLHICYSTGTAWFDDAQLKNLSDSR